MKKQTQQNSTANENNMRERIIIAAKECFASHGFEGTSIRKIAVEAGITFQLISYYYKGKEGLWRAVVESEIDRILDIYAKASEITAYFSPEDRFRYFVKAFVEYEATSTGLARLTLHEALARSNRYCKIINHQRFGGSDPVTSFLDDAMDQGILIDMPMGDLKLNFLSLITHRYLIDQHASLTLGEPVRSEAMIEKHATIVSNMFLKSSRPA